MKERILSLDVFRGLTMALMVLVNSPGNEHPYAILDHAEWNGCTLADLVFPAFLFIVGMTLVVSLKKQKNSPDYKAIIKRSILLFAVGLVLNVLPLHYHWDTYRIYGVLQRIALCYLICAILYVKSSAKILIALFITLLIAYWYLLTQIPIPGKGGDHLLIQSNWVGYVDQLILAPGHLYRGFFDPEGFLSTFSAIATTLSGVLTGILLLSDWEKPKKSVVMMSTGLLFLVLGWIWSFYFPINKALWTSSYVLWTSGISLCVFSLFFMIIDMFHYTRWTFPFNVFGMNALFIFVFHVILLKLQFVIHVTLPQGGTGNLKEFVSQFLFGSVSQPNSALLYALVFLGLNYLVALFLYKRRIFIRL